MDGDEWGGGGDGLKDAGLEWIEEWGWLES